MKASIGRIVTTLGLVTSNGASEHPAIITRVWPDEDGDTDPANFPMDKPLLVNLKVLPDMATEKNMGSIALFDNRADAERYIAWRQPQAGSTVGAAYSTRDATTLCPSR